MPISRQRRYDIACVALTLSSLLTCTSMYAAYFFEPIVFKGLTNMRLERSLFLPVAWMCVFLLLATISISSYLRCLMTDPGQVPFEFSFEAMADMEDEHNVASRLLLTPSRPVLRRVADETSNACDPCQVFKPQRTHHCSHCERCVLKYDHHCPWLGNCVGYYNSKFYLQFIVSTWLLAWVANLTLFNPAAHTVVWLLGADVDRVPGCGQHVHYAQYVHEARQNLPPRDFLSARIAPIPANWDAGVCGMWMLLIFILGILGQLWLGFLVNRHQWLLRHNMTTVEWVQFGQVKKGHWRYDGGSFRANLIAVFGKRARLRDYLFPTTPLLHVEDAVCAFAPVEVDSDDDIFADAKKWLEPMRRLSFSTPSYGATEGRSGRRRPPRAAGDTAAVSPLPMRGDDDSDADRAAKAGGDHGAGTPSASARLSAGDGAGDDALAVVVAAHHAVDVSLPPQDLSAFLAADDEDAAVPAVDPAAVPDGLQNVAGVSEGGGEVDLPASDPHAALAEFDGEASSATGPKETHPLDSREAGADRGALDMAADPSRPVQQATGGSGKKGKQRNRKGRRETF